jgi:hypothetical protein
MDARCRATHDVNSAVIAVFLAVGLLLIGLPGRSIAQTPSPLQEWQYVNAVPLMRLFQPAIPETEFVLGAGSEDRPLYDGAQNYRFVGGPIFDVDIATSRSSPPARDSGSIWFAARTSPRGWLLATILVARTRMTKAICAAFPTLPEPR